MGTFTSYFFVQKSVTTHRFLEILPVVSALLESQAQNTTRSKQSTQPTSMYAIREQQQRWRITTSDRHLYYYDLPGGSRYHQMKVKSDIHQFLCAQITGSSRESETKQNFRDPVSNSSLAWRCGNFYVTFTMDNRKIYLAHYSISKARKFWHLLQDGPSRHVVPTILRPKTLLHNGDTVPHPAVTRHPPYPVLMRNMVRAVFARQIEYTPRIH